MEVGSELQAPADLLRGQYPLAHIRYETVWSPRVGLDAFEQRKIFVHTGNRTPAVHPIARRYTD